MASADLQNAFYTLEMPEELRRFFGLRPVRAGKLGLEQLGGEALGPEEWLHPVVKVVPMGWSWALWWCQSVHEKIAERGGLEESERLRDRHPVTSNSFWHIQYVDNLHVLGTDEEEVKARFWKAVQALREAGLTVHEIEEGQTEDSSVKMLGWEIHGNGRVTPSHERLWRVRLAIRELLRRGKSSGQQLERLVGHMTFISLCRREALSVLGESYTFIRRHYQQIVPLWKSVRDELEKWDGIAPLIFSDLRRPWSERLLAVDASEWGLGVTTSQIKSADSQALGGCIERWRFREEEAKNPRQFVITEDEQVLANEIDLGRSLEVNHTTRLEPCPRSFKTVGFSAVDRNWQVVGRYRWQRKESMPVYEARASLHAIQHHLRSLENFEKRHVILTDSMTAAVAFDKGRAQGFSLRRVVQQTSALALASCCMFRMRWIPSEWNPADGPSRGQVKPSVPVRSFRDDPPTVGGGGDMAQQEDQEREGCITTTSAQDGSSFDLGHRAGGGEESRCEEENTSSSKTAEGVVIGARHIEGGFSQGRHQEEVPSALGELSKMEPRQSEESLEVGDRGSCEGDDALGYVSGGLPGVPLHEWRGPQCGELHHGSHSLQCSLAEESGCFTRGIAIDERVAKVVPSQKQNATALRSSVSGGSEGGAGAEGGDRARVALELFPLLEADGSLPTQSEGHREAGQKRRVKLWPLLFPVAPNGDGCTVEDAAVGRGSGVGPGSPEVSRPSFEQVVEFEQAKQGELGVFSHPRAGQQLYGKNVGTTGSRGPRSATHVPTSTWRSIARCNEMKYRSLTSIQTRGRWMAVKSVRNYEKGSRLAQLFGCLEENVQQRAIEAAKNVNRLF